MENHLVQDTCRWIGNRHREDPLDRHTRLAPQSLRRRQLVQRGIPEATERGKVLNPLTSTRNLFEIDIPTNIQLNPCRA